MIEEWSKEKARLLDDRSPLTPEILVQLCKSWQYICRDNFEIALFKAASLVAFLGARHVSEVVAASKADKWWAQLQKNDVRVVENRIFIHIRHSKTDQRTKGIDIMLGQCSISEYALFKLW